MKILFLYAHIDDESIMSYGTMRHLINQGHEVYLRIACGLCRADSERQQERYDNLYKFTERYGIDFYAQPNRDLELSDSFAECFVNTSIDEVRPDVIFTHSTQDLHQEHVLVGQKVILACRRFVGNRFAMVKKIYTSVSAQYEWNYGTCGNFNPNTFINITEYIEDKRTMLYGYEMEFPRQSQDIKSADSIIDRNKQTGQVVGCDYVESFQLVVEVI